MPRQFEARRTHPDNNPATHEWQTLEIASTGKEIDALTRRATQSEAELYAWALNMVAQGFTLAAVPSRFNVVPSMDGPMPTFYDGPTDGIAPAPPSPERSFTLP